MFRPDALKQSIKAEAHRLGFPLVGITRLTASERLPAYQGWLAEGRHGTMGYLATERARLARQDPGRFFAPYTTVVVVALPYANPASLEQPPAGDKPSGRVASYAWGGDYHDVIVPRLRELAGWIARATGRAVEPRPYADTGPLLERDLAQRAGLGWAGKNTCLIHPRFGSYFLLGELLLELDLPPDAPFTADLCGTCTRCSEACPTGCILPDRTIDARRCISYLTIELKDAVPPDLRSRMGAWTFGCDVCQMVCPWNLRFARLPADPALAPRPELPFPDLEADLVLDDAAFRDRFRGSPIRRAKRRGYLRNAAVNLGNAGRPSSVPALAYCLVRDPEPLVRGHAAWALGQIGTREARLALEAAVASETDPAVRDEITRALAFRA